MNTQETLTNGHVWPWLAGLTAVLALLLAWRVGALFFNGTDLFFDEAQYWDWSEDLAAGYFSKPPVLAFLIRGFTEIFGDAPWAVRLASPVLHSLTSLAVFWLAARLFDGRIAFWSGVAFATLPGIALSAGIISTDVPLLLFWALALIALHALIVAAAPAAFGSSGTVGSTILPGVLLGVTLGFGLMSKYAAIYLVLCLAVFLIATPEARTVLRAPGLWIALAVALAILAPNIWWNVENGGVTVAHTADNAKWGGDLLRPNKALEFFGAQFGVFGPIFFGAYLVIVWRSWKEGLGPAQRFLLCFSLPIIALITVQAFLSRAHANWAATAYVAASVLVVATMIQDHEWRWLKGSIALHVVVVIGLAFAAANADRLDRLVGVNPYARTLGWSAIARDARELVSRLDRPLTIVTTDRETSAIMLYYLRDLLAEPDVALRAWVPPSQGGAVKDHFQLTRPLDRSQVGPLIFVKKARTSLKLDRNFKSVELLATLNSQSGGKGRTVEILRVDGPTKAYSQ